jgi:deoxyribose-phosphate aldolase
MVRRAIGPQVLLKATLLFDHLDEDNKVAGTVLCLESGCDYVVAAGSRLSRHDIALIYDITQGERGIKASGPIKEWKVVAGLLEAGMTRLGTTWGASILKEQQSQMHAHRASWD